MVTRIIINFQFEATHSWPNCNIPEVSFLKSPHRHMFHVEMKRPVRHNDRDVEFIKFKRDVLKYVRENWEGKDLGHRSCENLACFLASQFGCTYVKVMEDGENGAEYEKQDNTFHV